VNFVLVIGESGGRRLHDTFGSRFRIVYVAQVVAQIFELLVDSAFDQLFKHCVGTFESPVGFDGLVEWILGPLVLPMAQCFVFDLLDRLVGILLNQVFLLDEFGDVAIELLLLGGHGLARGRVDLLLGVQQFEVQFVRNVVFGGLHAHLLFLQSILDFVFLVVFLVFLSYHLPVKYFVDAIPFPHHYFFGLIVHELFEIINCIF